MQSTTFDEVLGLEDKFYDDGFRQGYDDGVKAGRIEGRTFGLEKGFEKYAESGRLHGKSIIWANRMLHSPENVINADQRAQRPQAQISTESPDLQAFQPSNLQALPLNQRLAKNLKVLHALAESESLSTENTEEAVSDFDDRLKRAQGKAKIIERIVGGYQGDAVAVAGSRQGGDS
ncbi:hypothetical protein ONS95_003784 [Cadophora gregata]|uniref:uncharacterized protein n=1 Tax=Cadophora gregata TaxID=51156 RepID=UPI0026DC4029|nr:uncharacterized protein ONS95_003784 [Cadophora gregata]KAK0107075.1 hypothetical protein ONS95_003784 [Cadophora gregata]